MKILNEMTGQEMFFLLAGPCVIEGEEMALKIVLIWSWKTRLAVPRRKSLGRSVPNPTILEL